MEYTGNVGRKTSHSLSESSSDVSTDSSGIPSPVVITTTKKRNNDNVNKTLKYDDDNSDNTLFTDEEDDSNDDTNDDGIVTEINDVINDINDSWTKLRVVTNSKSDTTILLQMSLPKDQLSPPSNRDRVRLSRQKQTLIQKEVARLKNNKRSRDFYNNLSPTEKKVNTREPKVIGLSEMLSILLIVPRRKEKCARVHQTEEYHLFCYNQKNLPFSPFTTKKLTSQQHR